MWPCFAGAYDGFGLAGEHAGRDADCGCLQVISERVLSATQLDVNTVAAGGGSRLFFRGGMFVVGPESAGAHPGPVCYMKGST